MKILTRLRKRNKIQAFTLTEVIIATVIFSLALAGVFTSISQLRQPAVESSQEVTAAFLGKQILDDLRKEVNQESWQTPGSLLAIGVHGPITQNIGGKDYTYTYNVIADPNLTSSREVSLNVTWP